MQITRADLHQYLSNPNVQINNSTFIDANKAVIQRFLRKLHKQEQAATLLTQQQSSVEPTPQKAQPAPKTVRSEIDVEKAKSVLEKGGEFVKPSRGFQTVQQQQLSSKVVEQWIN